MSAARADISSKQAVGADPDPGGNLVARNELTHGRNVGQRWPACGGSYRERVHAASPNEFHGSGNAGEQHVHLAAISLIVAQSDGFYV